MVIVGSEHFRISVPMIKSLLFYRTQPLALHIITDPATRPAIVRYFATWNISDVSIHVHIPDATTIDLVKWVPNHHYGGVYAMLKLTLETLLPKTVHRIVLLDSDLTFAADIAELWRVFSSMNGTQCLGLVENQSGQMISIAVESVLNSTQ